MSKINTLSTLKELIVGVSSVGVSTVVMNVVKHTAPPNMKGITKVLTTIGGIVISAMVSAEADEYVNKQIDEMTSKTKKIIEEANKEESSNESEAVG